MFFGGHAGCGELVVTFAELDAKISGLLSSRVICWLNASMSAGAPRPDCRQACSHCP
jgi:hypothetical protein